MNIFGNKKVARLEEELELRRLALYDAEEDIERLRRINKHLRETIIGDAKTIEELRREVHNLRNKLDTVDAFVFGQTKHNCGFLKTLKGKLK